MMESRKVVSQALWQTNDLGQVWWHMHLENNMSKIRLSISSMLKIHSSSVLNSVNDNTITSITQIRNPSVIFDSFTFHMKSIGIISLVPLQFYTCPLVSQFSLPFLLTCIFQQYLTGHPQNLFFRLCQNYLSKTQICPCHFLI